jgi:genome maintenance exonuclease 1
MPDIVGSFMDLKPFFDNRIGTIYGQEMALYSDHFEVAGRVDCVAEFDGKMSIIDFKTSLKPKKKEWVESYFMQECFYAIAFEERTKIPVTQLVTIIAVDNSTPELYIEHRDDWVEPLREVIKEYNTLV